MKQRVSDEVLGQFARHVHEWTTLVGEGVLRVDEVVKAVETVIDDQDSRKLPIPAEGVAFELSHYFMDDPAEMAVRLGDPVGYNYEFVGNRLHGTLTRRFTLVTTTPVKDAVRFDLGLAATLQKGKVPDVQWIEAFRAKYKKPSKDSRGTAEEYVTIANPAWIDQKKDELLFPALLPWGLRLWDKSATEPETNIKRLWLVEID